MSETDSDHSERQRIEEIARQHPSAEEPDGTDESGPAVADGDSDQTAQRDSGAGEDYAGSGL